MPEVHHVARLTPALPLPADRVDKMEVPIGDQDGVDAALAYLRENREHGEAAYADALYELGDYDAAARQLIDRLEDPATRAAALMEVQHHPERPSLDPDPDRGPWEALLAREDVAAAIARHGRRLELPIHLPW